MREQGIQYVLTAPSGASITLNPTGFTGAGYYLKSVKLDKSMRVSEADRPMQHGSYLDPTKRRGLGWAIDAYMLHTGASNRQTLSDAAVQVLDELVDGSGVLTWTPQDSSAARRLTNITLAALDDSVVGGTLHSFSAVLRSEKPYTESSSASTVDSSSLSASGAGFVVPLAIPFTLTASSGGTLTFTNGGNVPIRPILRVYGPITAPNVVNVTANRRLAFTGTIAAGDYWEIDLFERMVTLNGVASATSPMTTLVPSTSTWFELATGASTLQLTGSAFDSSNTKLRAYQRAGWW